jgi:hypothetical protein
VKLSKQRAKARAAFRRAIRRGHRIERCVIRGRAFGVEVAGPVSLRLPVR